MWGDGGSSVIPSHPGGNVASNMSEAYYSSLLGGMPPTSTFLKGDILLRGNPIVSVFANT